jgi:hypothetical protein
VNEDEISAAVREHRNRLARLRRKARSRGYFLCRIVPRYCPNAVYLLFRVRDNKIVKAHLSRHNPRDPSTHGEMTVVEGWFA